jgi:hypothetical protein
MARPDSAALPIANVLLKALMVLNWFSGLAILVLLIAMPTERWILSAFDIAPSPEADRLVIGLHAIAIIGLMTIPLNDLVLRRLVAIVGAVRQGTPFAAVNAARLQTIAWSLLGLQILGLVIHAVARFISTAAHPVHLDAGFSLGGWLAVLLTFVLARVFAVGAHMRDDLEGTV